MSESEITKIINDILLKSGSIIVNKNLARNIGLDAAIFYSELCSKYKYFSQKKKLDKDGYFFNTVENMKNDTFLSDYRQREAIKKLKELDLIFYQKRGRPALRYFKVNMDYKRIARLTENLSNQNLNNRASNFKDTNLKKLDSNNTNPNNTNILNGIAILYSNTVNLNKYKESIDYYLRKYQECMKRPHPILKKEKWLKVIGKMQDFGDESGIDVPQDFNRLIDSYFKTDFPNYPCDRNILHFASNKIMLNRFYEELY
ncbi:hypothetical protein ES707_21263 [subsurface metagenome]